MSAVTRCSRCVQTADYPGITFDSQGVCSNCRYFERRWPAGAVQKTETDFLKLLEKNRRRRGKYDALVGLSGGKDSAYALHLMARKYNAKVLAFTYDNGFLHPGARKNIELMIDALHVDHRYVGLDPAAHKAVYRAMMRNRTPDLCGPCMNGIFAATNMLAMQEHVRLVIHGTSSRTEVVGIPPSLQNVMDFRYLVDTVSPYVKRPQISLFEYCDIPWMLYVLYVLRVKYVMLPDYVPWDTGDIMALLGTEYGWLDYGNGVPHFDCCVSKAFDYFVCKRLNTSKMIEHLSQKIRSGEMTRQEALDVIDKYHPTVEPTAAMDELCRRLGITREDIKPYLDGNVRHFRDFKGYTKIIQRFSPLLRLAAKFGIIPEDAYRKYNPANDVAHKSAGR